MKMEEIINKSFMEFIELEKSQFLPQELDAFLASEAINWKYIWLAEQVFDLTTYDDNLSNKYGIDIIEVMRVIRSGVTFEYIKDEDSYIKFINVCNLFNMSGLLEWGTSIRGCWFNYSIHTADKTFITCSDDRVLWSEEAVIYLLDTFFDNDGSTIDRLFNGNKKSNQKGKLIVIEGADACGKETQSIKLEEYLHNKGIPVVRLSFPTYESESAGPVKMYLSGELGKREDISPFAISALYAVDRFCTINSMHIQETLDAGTWVVCDRYVESNMIYHSSKITNEDDWIVFNNSLIDLEYNQFKIPTPDCVIYLNLAPYISNKLMEARGNATDIHESDKDFLRDVNANGYKVACTYDFTFVDCTDHDNDTILPIDTIHEKIVEEMYKTLEESEENEEE